MKRWVSLYLLRWLYRAQSPPAMIPYRGDWLYVDGYHQRIWRVRRTGQEQIPLSISLEIRG